ncbi:MAG: 2Fe-2S ferredoxin, partial [Pseudomonadota bacterium]|nr:2Fe-2S ferredoxin [Pseudomonadota bacterium]
DVRPGSRLSCQIRVTDDLNGLTVTVPDRQA